MAWATEFDAVRPYVVRLETPEGFGTGFLFAYNKDKRFAAIATAAHVVEHAHKWRLPINVRHHESGKEVFLAHEGRLLEIDHFRDSAAVVLPNPQFFPDVLLPMIDHSKYHRVGGDVAWMGYPGIADPHLCLFTGTIAAFVRDDDSYLIDGVAINGVSGGPVFVRKDGPQLIGSVSAYISNRQRGETLPGLLRAQDVSPFYTTINTLQSLDEERAKQDEAKQEAREREAAAQVQVSSAVVPGPASVEQVSAGELQVPAGVQVPAGEAQVPAGDGTVPDLPT